MRAFLIAFTLVLLLTLPGQPMQAQPDAPLYVLPGANVRVASSSTVDLAPNGRILAAANMLNDTISLVDMSARSLLAEIPVESDPRAVAFSPDGSVLLVVNRAAGTLSVVSVAEQAVIATHPLGTMPYAVVTGTQDRAYVSLLAEDAVIEINYRTGEVLRRFSVPDAPMGLTLWDSLLYVTHFWSGEVSLVYLPQAALVRTISPAPDASLAPTLAINRRTQRAYLPHSRSLAGNPVATFDSLVLPLVSTLDLRDLAVLRRDRLALDVIDRPVNMPFAVAIDEGRNRAYVVNAGSSDLSVIDLDDARLEAHVTLGVNPRGVRLSLDNSFVYVHNVIDGSITILLASSLQVDEVLPISDLRVPVSVLIGAELFHTAADPRVSAGRASCASCHFDGMSDGRVWRDFEGVSRNTPLLWDILATPPYNWSGDHADLLFVEGKMRSIQLGTGLDVVDDALVTSGEVDLENLLAYIAELPTPSAPPGADDEAVLRGAALFQAQGCTDCHAGAAGTDGMAYDVGTGGTFDTPTLNGLWQSAPYLHDGRAATLQEVFIVPGQHQLVTTLEPDDLEDLAAYLLSLPAGG